jgi:hypothetical protein
MQNAKASVLALFIFSWGLIFHIALGAALAQTDWEEGTGENPGGRQGRRANYRLFLYL